MLPDGEICHVETEGTELQAFSFKGRRVVVIAAQAEDVAFVYPLTTRRGDGKWQVDWQPGKSWVVVEKGLYAVPLARLTSAGERWTRLHHHRKQVERDLARREEARLLGEDAARLVVRAFTELRHLPRPADPPAKAPPARPSTGDLFRDYLEQGGLERDLRDGRHRDG